MAGRSRRCDLLEMLKGARIDVRPRVGQNQAADPFELSRRSSAAHRARQESGEGEDVYGRCSRRVLATRHGQSSRTRLGF